MSDSRWFGAVMALWVAVGGVVGVRCVVAQIPPRTGVVNVFVPADRSLRQHLVRAAKAIEEERYSDAVTELGELLSSPAESPVAGGGQEPQDFFLDASPQSGSRTSLKTEAQRLLGTLPPKGRELYELQFGAAARSLLGVAIQDGSVEKLHEVARRYFHTRAGSEATLLLGRLYLDEGRPLAAALCLKQLADLPALAAGVEPELSVLLAACWYRAGQPENAQQTIAGLVTRSPRVRLRLGSSDSEALPAAGQVLPWLEQHFGAGRPVALQLAQWALFRGDESRNAASRGGVPLESLRWQVPVAGFEQDQRVIEELQQTYREQSIPMLPSLQPLAVNNVILMRTHDLLMAVDFETGKRVWNYPWWDVPSSDELAGQTGLPASSEREIRKVTLSQRLWQDMPFGQVSSDGEFVFLLDDLRHQPTLPSRPQRLFPMRGMMAFPNADVMTPHNQLVALELKREGALHWKVGGETGWDEPQLAGVYFLGPPLPLFGQLYVLAEVRGEVRLVVLDAATGRQQWAQQLAHLEPFWSFDPTLRRLSGATPSFADGVLVCPTSAGAVVGVDIAARRLLWGYQYSQSQANAGHFGLPYANQFQTPLGRWLDSTATVADGCVVLTPPESDQLICLDLLTGQPRWKPLSRQGAMSDMLFVACVRDGKIILVGKNRLMAHHLSDGTPAWKQPAILDVDRGEMPSGRGFLAGEHYYLPTTAAELIAVDVRTGQLADRVRTNQVLGNLICFRDDVVSLGPDRATASYQLEPLRTRVAQRLQQNPQDAWGLARRGELLLYDRKPAEALESLQQANRLEPKDEGVRALLVSTFLSALKQDFAQHQALATQIEPLIESESQRIDYLMMLGAGRRSAGDLAAATEAYVKLAQHAFRSLIGSEAPAVSPAAGWSVRLDRFVQAQLSELWRLGDSPVQEQIERLVRELRESGVAESAAAGSDLVTARFLGLCGFHPASEPIWLLHAEQLLDSGKLSEALLALSRVESSREEKLVARATFLRARLYSQAKDAGRVAAAYRQLDNRWPDLVIDQEKTGRQLFEEALAKGLTSAETADVWPVGRVEVRESSDAFNRQGGGFRRIASIPVEQRAAGEEHALRMVFDTAISTAYVRDGSGEVLARLPDNSHAYQGGPVRVMADGGLLFVSQGGRAFAVSLLRSRARDGDQLLWQEPLLPIPAETGTSLIRQVPRTVVVPFDTQPKSTFNFEDASNRPVAVMGPMNRGGVCFQKVRTLTCVDALTGKPVWSRHDFDQGLELFGDDQYVFAAGRDEKECSMLDAVDGRLLGRRPLPPSDHRWTTVGRRILAWEEKGEDGYRLYLHDVEQQRDIWSEQLPKETRGCLVDQVAVAMLQPDGKFFIRSLSDERRRVEAELPIENELNVKSVHVRASRDQWLVIINDDQTLPDELQTSTSTNAFAVTPVNGRIFAFDRKTGSRPWPTAAVVRGFSIPVEQPEDLPTLWCVRQYKLGQIGQTQSSRTDVVCLDRRTGGVLLDRRNVPTQTNSLQVTADAGKREVSLTLPQVTFTLKFTDEPRPPETPAQLSSTGVKTGLEQIGNMIKNVGDAIRSAGTSAAKSAAINGSSSEKFKPAK